MDQLERKRLVRNRRLLSLGIFLVLITTAFFMRVHLMRSAALFLMKEDRIEDASAIFVLSGNPVDRGMKAAKLLEDGFADRIICVGDNPERKLEAYNMKVKESDMTAKVIADYNKRLVKKTEIIYQGTSTFEESEAILNYCLSQKLQNIIIVSDKFHLRRVDRVFRKKFEGYQIQYTLVGASNATYDEQNWWESEYGLIALNNEYMKLLYYFFKY